MLGKFNNQVGFEWMKPEREGIVFTSYSKPVAVCVVLPFVTVKFLLRIKLAF